jgi:uncharacterized protein (DUF1800 family)
MTIKHVVAAAVHLGACKHFPALGHALMHTRTLIAAIAALFVLTVPVASPAQTTSCPLTVSGPATNPPRMTVDGVLFARFAVGIRGPALVAGLGMNANDAALAEGTLGGSLTKLDVDGDGVFSVNDATVLSRYLAGFRDAALSNGLTINAGAKRKLGTELSTFVSTGCPTATPTFSPKQDAARLLQQATWGATVEDIDRVATVGGPAAWIDDQFTKPASSYTAYALQLIAENLQGRHGCDQTTGCPWNVHNPVFYKFAIAGQDQLRQRATNALHQILVVSISNNTVLDAEAGMASYVEMLSNNIFSGNTTNASGQPTGNFRKILKDVTLHPAMGTFLDMRGSQREVPNENYARELMQLFSVGTVFLNNDGSVKVDTANKPIPTYTEATVQNVAKAFTGWNFANSDLDARTKGYWRTIDYPNRNWVSAMTPWNARRCANPDGRLPDDLAGTPPERRCYTNCAVFWDQGTNPNGTPKDSYPDRYKSCSIETPHDTSAKTLLQYPNALFPTLAAGNSAEVDIEQTIDNIFYHPNVGPFIASQMIQRMVTSNPTKAYVARIANIFNNNGNNIRGDMKAVVKAILLDDEARSPTAASQIYFGKFREPVLKFTQLHRAFNAASSSGYYAIYGTENSDTLNQAPWRPPSVFNYYSPEFQPTGATMYKDFSATHKDTFLYAPESEITNTSSVAGFSDFVGWGILNGFSTGNPNDPDAGRWNVNYVPYLSAANPLADSPQAMVDRLDLLLTAGNLKPAFKADLVAMVAGITRSDITEQRSQRFTALFWQIVNSADYAIQR